MTSTVALIDTHPDRVALTVEKLDELLRIAHEESRLVAGDSLLSATIGAELTTSQLATLLDQLAPALDAREAWLRSVNGHRRATAVRGRESTATPDVEPLEEALRNFPTAIRERMLAAGSRDQVVADVLPLSRKTLEKVRLMLRWAKDVTLPVEARSTIAGWIRDIDEGAKVDGLYRQARALNEEYAAPSAAPALASVVSAQAVVTKLVTLVTDLELHVQRLNAAGLLAQAVHLDAGGRAALNGVLMSVERTINDLRTVASTEGQ
ncbi:hypothetical protein [Agromyces sp. Soil535]|uniref:hypothetical protein n=1 Tax=Agromyces sp. Soil535 TaxID=1736390 RepID=UPI000B0062CA|nr:hypothetical protein [Agromyces sp. Soil535]